LHYSVVRQVWTAIAEAARRFNAQIFATTHSWECILSAHEAFTASEQYDFRLHRLDRINGSLKSVTYSRENIATSLELNLEVR